MQSPNDTLAASLNLPRPSLWERLLRWIGFSYPPFVDLTEVDADPRFVSGALIQCFTLKLTLKDRLLILLGGNVAMRSFVKVSHSVERSATRGAWSIIEPGAEFK